MMKKFNKYIILLLLALNVQCTEWLEIEPEGLEVVDNAMTDAKSANQVVNGAYQPFLNLFSGPLFQQIIEFPTDDLWVGRGGDQFNNDNLDQLAFDNQMGGQIWNQFYVGIARSNIILNRIDDVSFSQQEAQMKENIKGQAYFLRAFYYYYLSSFYGGVPLILTEITSPEDARVAKTPMEEVIGQVKKDLEAAIPLLPETLNGSEGYENGKATKYAAHALLAYVNLSIEEWDEVISHTDAIINSGYYDTVAYTAVFHHDNPALGQDYSAEYKKDVLFDARFDSPYWQNFTRTISPMQFTDGSGQIGTFIITDDELSDYVIDKPASGNGLMQAFEPGDKRKDEFILTSFDQRWNTETSEIFKYWNNMNQIPLTGQQAINYPIFRYPDVLLMKAEALNEKGAGNAEGVHIINDLIRKRAGLSPLSEEVTSSQDAFREAIWKERRVELCFEGKRYFDLNRTGRFKEVLVGRQNNIRQDFVSSHSINHPITGKPMVLLPIPQEEINANPNIENNPGY